jgi:hypothetical protein
MRENDCVSADGEISGDHQAVTLLATKVMLRDRWRNGESAGEHSGDPTGPLAGPRMRGDPWPRVQGEVRWRGRCSAVALREASHCRRHHLGAGCNVPLERQRLAISSDGGERDKAMGGVCCH